MTRKRQTMELVFNPTRKVTTAELFITCEPPLEFTVKVSIPRSLRLLMSEFSRGDYGDMEQAKQIIARSFVSVTQNGQTYPLDSPEAAEALRVAIGDDAILAVAGGFVDNHYTFFTRDRTDSES